jgi:hypothetical protein
VSNQCSLALIGTVLIVLSGIAQAQCENMRVIVRYSVYPIHGLDAFCQEFNKMKADIASMKSALSDARQENAMLRGQLEIGAAQSNHHRVVKLNPVQRQPENTDSPQ